MNISIHFKKGTDIASYYEAIELSIRSLDDRILDRVFINQSDGIVSDPTIGICIGHNNHTTEKVFKVLRNIDMELKDTTTLIFSCGDFDTANGIKEYLEKELYSNDLCFGVIGEYPPGHKPVSSYVLPVFTERYISPSKPIHMSKLFGYTIE